MNASRLFTIEFFIAVGITSWGAIKEGYAPWPPNVVYSSVAMAILSLTAAIDEKLSVLLGAGFLLALILNNMSSGEGTISQTFAAIPQTTGYDVLSLNGSTPAATTGDAQ